MGRFDNLPEGLEAPASEVQAIVKGTPFEACRAVYVGTGGDLVATTRGGQVRTWKNVPSGTELNVRLTNVDVGSTAADLLAYY